RPSFAQKGNTYFPLRNIIPDAGNGNGTTAFQFFGLLSEFRPVVASGQLDLGNFHPTHIILDGELVYNTAFNSDLISAFGLNNRGPTSDPNNPLSGPFQGGPMGWLGRVTVGNREIKHFGDWNVHAGYKYLESDATVDAFVDSDFGLGGTNLKGYFLGGNYALSNSVTTTVTWMSASTIAGSPYAVDLLQLDLNAKF